MLIASGVAAHAADGFFGEVEADGAAADGDFDVADGIRECVGFAGGDIEDVVGQSFGGFASDSGELAEFIDESGDRLAVGVILSFGLSGHIRHPVSEVFFVCVECGVGSVRKAVSAESEFAEGILHSGDIEFFCEPGHFSGGEIAGFLDGGVDGILGELLQQLLIAGFDEPLVDVDAANVEVAGNANSDGISAGVAFDFHAPDAFLQVGHFLLHFAALAGHTGHIGEVFQSFKHEWSLSLLCGFVVGAACSGCVSDADDGGIEGFDDVAHVGIPLRVDFADEVGLWRFVRFAAGFAALVSAGFRGSFAGGSTGGCSVGLTSGCVVWWCGCGVGVGFCGQAGGWIGWRQSNSDGDGFSGESQDFGFDPTAIVW